MHTPEQHEGDERQQIHQAIPAHRQRTDAEVGTDLERDRGNRGVYEHGGNGLLQTARSLADLPGYRDA